MFKKKGKIKIKINYTVPRPRRETFHVDLVFIFSERESRDKES
jgi:hypothetical protein